MCKESDCSNLGCCGGAGLIPGPVQWDKGSGTAVSHSYGSSSPGPGTSIYCCVAIEKKKRKKEKKKNLYILDFIRTPGKKSSCCGSVLTNLTSIHEDMGSIPGLAQWIKDLAVL